MELKLKFVCEDNHGNKHISEPYELLKSFPDEEKILEDMENPCNEILTEAQNYCECNPEFDKGKVIGVKLFTGLIDKNKIEIYSGDVVREALPIRLTQTHEGDNIPSGSYTEPLEPLVEVDQFEVNMANGYWNLGDKPFPYTAISYKLEEAKELFSGGWSGYGAGGKFIWDHEEDGDLQYLLNECGLETEEELIEYLGIEVVGDSLIDPNLLK